jgi:hypothetical protein
MRRSAATALVVACPVAGESVYHALRVNLVGDMPPSVKSSRPRWKWGAGYSRDSGAATSVQISGSFTSSWIGKCCGQNSPDDVLTRNAAHNDLCMSRSPAHRSLHIGVLQAVASAAQPVPAGGSVSALSGAASWKRCSCSSARPVRPVGAPYLRRPGQGPVQSRHQQRAPTA